MPRATLAQLVLAELAAAAVLGGLALHGSWRFAGAAIGLVALLLAGVALQRRWLYQVLGSWAGLHRRRRVARRADGVSGLLGDCRVEAVPGGRDGGTFGVLRSGTTWCVPLRVELDGVLNDDAAVPVALLAGLLQIEDVPLSSVRLVTLCTPAQSPRNAPAGPIASLAQTAQRFCLLTVDSRRAADAIAARGGSAAAVQQILRRCAVHTEQVLATADLAVRRLDEAAVAALLSGWLGPSGGRHDPHARESWRDVRVGGTWSTVCAITGTGADLPGRVARLTAAAPAPLVATTLLIRPARRGPRESTLVRLSGPGSVASAEAGTSLRLLARAYDLRLQPLSGEQGTGLRVTLPVGVGE